jgi:hypothetical protein
MQDGAKEGNDEHLIGRYDRICYEEFLRKENSDSIT